MKVTIGADPEVVLLDKNGMAISAIPIIKAAKECPDVGAHGTLYSHDNVMAEFAITPCTSKGAFLFKTSNAMQSILECCEDIKEVVSGSGCIYRKSELEHPDAMRFGCEPDFNAHTKRVNIPVKPNSPFRASGGHIHIGAADQEAEFLKTFSGKIAMVKVLDVMLTPVLDLLEMKAYAGAKEQMLNRRSLYGRAGAHRPKTYGVEYRTPSSFWTGYENIVELVWDILMVAVRQARKYNAGSLTIDDILINQAVKGINECDEDMLKSIIITCSSYGLYENAKKDIDDILKM